MNQNVNAKSNASFELLLRMKAEYKRLEPLCAITRVIPNLCGIVKEGDHAALKQLEDWKLVTVVTRPTCIASIYLTEEGRKARDEQSREQSREQFGGRNA